MANGKWRMGTEGSEGNREAIVLPNGVREAAEERRQSAAEGGEGGQAALESRGEELQQWESVPGAQEADRLEEAEAAQVAGRYRQLQGRPLCDI